jgi:hypothetical protein
MRRKSGLGSRGAARGVPDNALQRRAPRCRVNRLVHSRPAAQVQAASGGEVRGTVHANRRPTHLVRG